MIRKKCTGMMVVFVTCSIVALGVSESTRATEHQRCVFEESIGSLGEAPGKLRAPTSLEILPDGRGLVIDSRNHRIVMFSAEMRFERQWGSYGLDIGQFYFPLDCVYLPDGRDSLQNVPTIAVIDRSFRIQFFNLEGRYLDKVKVSFSPVLCAADPHGNLWFLDAHKKFWRLQKNSRNPEQQQLPYQPQNPTDFIISRNTGEFAVSELDHEVIRFSPNQPNLIRCGSAGFSEGQFYFPSGISFCSDDSIAVVDLLSSRIQFFDKTGLIQAVYTIQGQGEFQSVNPVKIAMTGTGKIFVSDKYHHRVILYSIDS